MRADQIQIRDPFVVEPTASGQPYWLFGSTDADIWRGPAQGFDCYWSTDLEHWQGPLPAFRPPEGFWSHSQFWAPEVHRWQDGWYLFATFKPDVGLRGTAVLRAEQPQGPYRPWSDGPVTPARWACLDGTLAVQDGRPYLVFCHEWQQVCDGEIWAVELLPDLSAAVGQPRYLFSASQAPWAAPHSTAPDNDRGFDCYVTDGPFLRGQDDGSLGLFWSSFDQQGDYAIGLATSQDGLFGPWTQQPVPVWSGGGHGMVFTAADGRPHLTWHSPNQTPLERFVHAPLVTDPQTGALLAQPQSQP